MPFQWFPYSPKTFSRMGQIPQKDGRQTGHGNYRFTSFLPIYVICILFLLIYIFVQSTGSSSVSSSEQELQRTVSSASPHEETLTTEGIFCLQKRGAEPGGWETGRAVWILPPFPSCYLRVICLAFMSFSFLLCKVWNNRNLSLRSVWGLNVTYINLAYTEESKSCTDQSHWLFPNSAYTFYK